MITIAAPAKLNLTLEVLGNREDGYHEIRSVMQAIDLRDVLSFEETGDGKLSLSCSDQALNNVDNLAMRAAILVQDEYRVTSGANIGLVKRIPDAGGLGGGSSDAAAAIRGLNTLWSLGMSVDEMVKLGARLGSDVPFFIHGRTALAEGRGEIILPISYSPKAMVVLLFPPVAAIERKTARLYAALDAESFSRGEHTEALVAVLRRGQEISGELLYNVFDSTALQAFDGLKKYRDAAQNLAGRKFHLAGSGPTLFAWCNSEADAARTRDLLRTGNVDASIAGTL